MITRLLIGAVAIFIILLILWEAFETIVLPRRVTRRFRLTRYLLRSTWYVWSGAVRGVQRRSRRESYLGFFGPLSVFFLLATWAVGMIVGFGLLQWALGSKLAGPGGSAGLGTDLYMSGTTFFTLGLGDVVPSSRLARVVTVIEAGLGFAFLALVITYLPVLYQVFSRREARISLLDARAGSPPTAAELLRRLGQDRQGVLLEPFLQEWELWAAELLESHISYPILALFRSQHDNQSWLAALTTILDSCTLAMVIIDGGSTRTASLTFAMARHAVVDLCQIFNTPPQPPASDRLPRADLERLRALLRGSGVRLREEQAADERIAELRAMYEPYVNAMSQRLLMDLPAWLPASGTKDNWQRSAWH